MYTFKCDRPRKKAGCGHIFESSHSSQATCPKCGEKTFKRLRHCKECGKDYFGQFGKNNMCIACSRKTGDFYEPADDSMFNNKGLDVPKELLAGVPRDIQHHIKHEYFLNPELANNIAKCAKSVEEAIEMRDNFHKQRYVRQSYGVAEYG